MAPSQPSPQLPRNVHASLMTLSQDARENVLRRVKQVIDRTWLILLVLFVVRMLVHVVGLETWTPGDYVLLSLPLSSAMLFVGSRLIASGRHGPGLLLCNIVTIAGNIAGVISSNNLSATGFVASWLVSLLVISTFVRLRQAAWLAAIEGTLVFGFILAVQIGIPLAWVLPGWDTLLGSLFYNLAMLAVLIVVIGTILRSQIDTQAQKSALVEELCLARTTLEATVEARTADLQRERDVAQRVMATMTEGLGVTEIESGKIVFANHALSKMLGYEPVEMHGLRCIDVTQPASLPTLQNEQRKRLNGERSDYVLGLQRKDGSHFDAQVKVVSQFDPLHDRPVRAIAVISDVTSRHQNELELRRQKAYLQALHTTSLGLMRRLELRELFKDILDNACSLVGTDSGYFDLVSENGESIVSYLTKGGMIGSASHPRRKGEGMGGMVLATGESIVVNDYQAWANRLIKRSGPPVYAAISAPLKVAGRVVGVFGVAHMQAGVTFGPAEVETINRFAELAAVAYDNAQLYAAVRKERDFALQVMEGIGQGLAVSNAHGAIEYVNPALLKMLGYALSEVVDRPTWRLTTRSQLRICSDVIKLRAPTTFETMARKRDGLAIPVLLSTSPRIVDGAYTGDIGVFTDLTDIKQTEQALRDARNRAEEASRLKSRFLATLSHEVRTPMNAIMGMTELVLDSRLEAEQRELLKVVHESSSALMDMLNDMLDFAKIESGKLAIRHEDFDLVELLKSTAALFAGRARANGLVFEHVFDVTPSHMVRGDATRIRQVLINLLGNALKFTEHGHIQLRTGSVASGTLAVQSSDPLIRFDVIDSGIGMSDDVRGRLFEAFAQGDSSATKRFGGTGLGLAICKNLVELMGGQIGVTSVMNEGSCFSFVLPLPQSARLQ